MENVIHELSRNPGVIALIGFILFVAGVGTGILLSSVSYKGLVKVPSTPKKLKELEKGKLHTFLCFDILLSSFKSCSFVS